MFVLNTLMIQYHALLLHYCILFHMQFDSRHIRRYYDMMHTLPVSTLKQWHCQFRYIPRQVPVPPARRIMA